MNMGPMIVGSWSIYSDINYLKDCHWSTISMWELEPFMVHFSLVKAGAVTDKFMLNFGGLGHALSEYSSV